MTVISVEPVRRSVPERTAPARRPSYLASSLGDGPWAVADLPKAGTRVLIGAIAVTVGWVGSSGTAVFSRQLLWTAVAVAGAAVAALGGALWLLAGLGRLRTERTVLREVIAATLSTASAGVALDDAPQGWVAAAGMRRYHAPSCPLVQGKALEVVAVGDRQPCGVCVSEVVA